MSIPAQGRSADELLAELEERTADDLRAGPGALAYAYDHGDGALVDSSRAAHARLLGANGLDPTAFPSLIRLENDVVGMVTALLGGGPEHRGTFTSGGTESIMLAVKAARDARPGIARPKLVKPSTGHPAFDKAGHYLGVEVVSVPVDPVTFRADPDAMAAAIDERTVLVVASAVSYPHGVLDPVGPIAAAAAAAGTLCHVDGCVGGFLLPFQQRLGHDLEPFDLSVPGVTSMSADLHKYGYAPKGASVVVFRDAELRGKAYFASADWPGYTVINASVQSTKSGGPLASAWVVLQQLGLDGYDRLVGQSLEALDVLRGRLDALEGVRVLGDPITAMLAVAGDGVDILQVADELRARDVLVQVQLSHGSSPVNLHLSTYGASAAHASWVADRFAEAVEAARAAGPPDVPEDLASILAGLTAQDITEEAFAGLVAAAGIDLGGGPLGPMAGVNHVLDQAPVAVREALLGRFLSALFTPAGPAAVSASPDGARRGA